MKQRFRKHAISSRVRIGIFMRRVEQLQAEIAEAFTTALKSYASAATAVRDALKEFVAAIVLRPIVNGVLGEMSGVFRPATSPLNASKESI